MYDDILVPFDGSDEARKGAEHAVELAATCGAKVHALYVIDLPGAPRTVYVRDDEEELRAEYREYGEEVTAEVCDMAADAGVDCVAAIRTGSPSEEIAEYGDDEGVGLIVLGSAYRGRFHALLGSVAEKVVRTSEIPVLTTRMGPNE